MRKCLIQESFGKDFERDWSELCSVGAVVAILKSQCTIAVHCAMYNYAVHRIVIDVVCSVTIMCCKDVEQMIFVKFSLNIRMIKYGPDDKFNADILTRISKGYSFHLARNPPRFEWGV